MKSNNLIKTLIFFHLGKVKPTYHNLTMIRIKKKTSMSLRNGWIRHKIFKYEK